MSLPYERKQNIVAAAVLLGVGIVAAIVSWRLGVGEPADPGPGLWPLIVSVALVVFAAVLVVRSHPTRTEERFSRDSLVVVGAVLSLVAYAFLFERVGFEIPTIALLVLWLKGFGRESWKVTTTVSVGATAVVYLLFITGLNLSLPHIVHL